MNWIDSIIDWVVGWFNTSANPRVVAVREVTVELCGFLPTVETVVNLIAANPVSTTAVMIAKKICAAVSPDNGTAKTSLRKPTVDGVEIEGEWIR
jgi:hypothetical protein